MSEVHPELAAMLSQVTDEPAERFTAGTRFDELPEWSSYSALRLLAAIEQRFDVRLNLEAYFAIKDVAGLVAAVADALPVNVGAAR